MTIELKLLQPSPSLPVQPEETALFMKDFFSLFGFAAVFMGIIFIAMFIFVLFVFNEAKKSVSKEKSELNSKILKSNFKDVFNDFSKLYMQKFFEGNRQTFLFFDDIDFLITASSKGFLAAFVSERSNEAPQRAVAVARFSRLYSSWEDHWFNIPVSPRALSGTLNFECLNHKVHAEIEKGKAKVFHNDRGVGTIDFNSGLAFLGDRPVFKILSSDSTEFQIEHVDKGLGARLAYTLPWVSLIKAPSYFYKTQFYDKKRIGAHFLFSSISGFETLNEDEKALLLSIALFIHVCFFFRVIIYYRSRD